MQVFDGGCEIDLGAPAQRSLFGVLALRVNAVISLDRLVGALWGDTAPKSAEGGIYTYVSGLRKALQPGWTRGSDHSVLTSTRTGYSLVLPEDAVDVIRFEAAVAHARRRWSAGDSEQALAQCELAIAEWGGTPLSGAGGPFVDGERARLESLKLDVDELRAAALIETGSPTAAVTAVSELTAENPLRERLYELWMLALHRSGRQAEALDVYRQARRRLVDELGIEPGPALRRMHQRVLTGDEESDAPATMLTRHTRAVTPAQLPHATAHFTGRADELRTARELCLAAAGDAPGDFSPLLAIDGTAGVGKTALAVHLARQMSDRFPDGQLFLDLRGFDPRAEPLPPEEALDHLLRGLGADVGQLEQDSVAKAALYRSLTAGRRLLVVLDNASDTEQVRPLLPGTKGCVTIVTSRNRLSGLVARDGATRVGVETLTPAESLDLLRRVLGSAVVQADLASAQQVARLCGHLPLALRIAAERIVGSEHYALSDLVEDLQGGRRLDELAAPDDDSSVVRSVFSWSYRALERSDARTFRLLGLHPGTELGVLDSAALLAVDAQTARRLLDRLVRRHLLEQIGSDRYRFHDLLRVYAAECAFRDEPSSTTSAVVDRLLGWYAGSAVAAREVIAPGLGDIVVAVDPWCPLQTWTTYDNAMGWVRRELSVLIEALRLAVDRGLHQSAAGLATALGALCHSTSRWSDWLRVVDLGRTAARQAGDKLSEGRLANDAGVAYHFLGRHDDAIASHETAIDILERFGDRCDRSIATNLAVAYSMMGRQLEALPLLEEAISLAHEQGNRLVEASVADSLGAAMSKLGRHDEAVAHGIHSATLLRQGGSEHMLAHALTQLGDSCFRAGRFEEAAGHFDEALQLWRRLGDQWGEMLSQEGVSRSRAAVVRACL